MTIDINDIRRAEPLEAWLYGKWQPVKYVASCQDEHSAFAPPYGYFVRPKSGGDVFVPPVHLRVAYSSPGLPTTHWCYQDPTEYLIEISGFVFPVIEFGAPSTSKYVRVYYRSNNAVEPIKYEDVPYDCDRLVKREIG